MNFGTWLFTMLKGRRAGADAYGNTYYTERRPRAGLRVRRWVTYAGPAEASRVPPEWHAWLHYTTDAPVVEQPRNHPRRPAG
jgi:NADH:ubiquinone oxidoreductase subunit